MSVVSVIHTKGGVGKTTSSVFLAAVAAQRGLSVVLVDADPQGSAIEWAADAAAAGDELPFPVVPATAPLRVPSADLVIIDTPPGSVGAIQAAIKAADLILVPTGASPLDMRRVWPTLEITDRHPTAVLLTGIDLRTRLADEVRTLLDAEGVPVVGTPILRREDLRRAYGSTPTHMHGYDQVFTELMEALSHV